jgi:hypothetical protein
VLLGTPPELAYGGTFTVWGPQVYQRSTAAPVPVVSSFSISNPSASYTLKIYNGGRSGLQTGERVSSAVISLNGAVLVGPQNFNQKITEIGFPVKLLPSNQLSVELRSKAGSLLVVEIVGMDNALPLLNFTAPTGLVIMGSSSAAAQLSVQYSDALSGLDLSSLRITVDGVELTPYYIGASSADCSLPALS